MTTLTAPAGRRIIATSPSYLSRRWQMQMSRAIEAFLRTLETNAKAPETVKAYRSDLNRLKDQIGGRDTVLRMTPDLVRRVFERALEDGLAPATLHRKAACLREFIRWGAEQRFWDAGALCKEIPRYRRPAAIPNPYTAAEIAALWKLALPSEERVLRALLFFTGLRIGAIRDLLVGNIAFEPPTLRAMTKGGKPVLKHLHPTLVGELDSYLRTAEKRPQDYLFAKKGGRPLRRQDLEEIVARWGAAAGVRRCIPHRFRHTFATALLEGGADIRDVKEQLDHADIKSTMGYTRVVDARLKAALLRLPESWGDSHAQTEK